MFILFNLKRVRARFLSDSSQDYASQESGDWIALNFMERE